MKEIHGHLILLFDVKAHYFDTDQEPVEIKIIK